MRSRTLGSCPMNVNATINPPTAKLEIATRSFHMVIQTLRQSLSVSHNHDNRAFRLVLTQPRSLDNHDYKYNILTHDYY